MANSPAVPTLNQLTAVLQGVGVSETDAPRLAGLLATPMPGSFDPRELDTTSPPHIALLALVVAVMRFVEFTQSVSVLLQYLEAQQRELTPFDLGRYFHLKGYVAGRDHSVLYGATRSLNRSLEVLESVGSDDARAYIPRVHDTLGQILAQHGLLADARHELGVALEGRRAAGDLVGMGMTLGNLGQLCVASGDWAAAVRYLVEDLSLVETNSPELTAVRAMLTNFVGTALMQDGKLPEAEIRFQESARLAAMAADARWGALAEVGLGWLALRRGHCDVAMERVESARDALATSTADARFLEEPYARIVHLEAAVALRVGDASRAVELFRDAHARVANIPSVSAVDRANLLYELSLALFDSKNVQEASLRLREAVHCLDATAADTMRLEMESVLRTRFHDSWLLHSAGRFLGQKQIEFLLGEAGRGGFRGERKDVAVLFSDVRGFTTISEKLAPEEVITLLNDLLGHMTRCIEGVGGMVDKFIGDAVMAVFSLPETHVEDAETSIVAALSMRNELERINRRLKDTPPLAVGIGIHFGSVVAGLIGSPQKRSYTVIGDVVNTASRLEGMTKQLGASILVSEQVVERLPKRERFLIRPIGMFVPKGRHGAVMTYDVMGERDASAASAAADREISLATSALEMFWGRRFDLACERFRELVHIGGVKHEAGYKLLLSTAEEFSTHPPPDSWQGEVELHEK